MLIARLAVFGCAVVARSLAGHAADSGGLAGAVSFAACFLGQLLVTARVKA
jgi:hypothetical protein